MTFAYKKFLNIHFTHCADGLRVGQRFVNMYIKKPWPELFYADETKSAELISGWLEDNQYFDELPPVVNPAFKENGELN